MLDSTLIGASEVTNVGVKGDAAARAIKPSAGRNSRRRSAVGATKEALPSAVQGLAPTKAKMGKKPKGGNRAWTDAAATASHMSLVDYASTWHGGREIESRRPDGAMHRST